MLRLYRLYYLDSLSAAARSGRRQPTADQSVLRRERPIFRSGYPKAGIFDRCCDYGSLYGRRLSCKSKNRHSVWCFGGDKCRGHSISSVFPRNAAVSGVCPHYDFLFLRNGKECSVLSSCICRAARYASDASVSSANAEADRRMACRTDCAGYHLCDCLRCQAACGC